MTSEEREKCAWLFHVFTGETLEPHKWNDKAAEKLYEMIRKIKHCSTGLAHIPTVPPLSSNPARYLAGYVFDVIKKQVKLQSSETTVIEACKNVAIVRGLAREIKLVAMGLWVN